MLACWLSLITSRSHHVYLSRGFANFLFLAHFIFCFVFVYFLFYFILFYSLFFLLLLPPSHFLFTLLDRVLQSEAFRSDSLHVSGVCVMCAFLCVYVCVRACVSVMYCHTFFIMCESAKRESVREGWGSCLAASFPELF